MTFAKNFFFGESILKSRHIQLKKQLIEGSITEKNIYWVIVVKEQGPNLFECVSMEEFKKIFEAKSLFILAGLIADRNEFPNYVTRIVEELLEMQQTVSKTTINRLLQGDLDE